MKLGLSVFLGSAIIGTASSATTPPDQAMVQEVLVTGERPGPGMWRVSKGDHDLWILATLDPLPKKMFWRSRLVEKRISSSQLVLAPPEVMVDVHFFSYPAYRAALVRARRDPGDQTLAQALPPDVYLRWKSLQTRYLAHESYEHIRPVLAAVDLYDHAVEQSGLNSDDHNIWGIVERKAHSHHVRILAVTVGWQRDKAFNWLRELNEIPREEEVGCLEKTIERLETDLEPMRHRANLWSIGDVDGLRAQSYPDDRFACFRTLFSVSKWHEQLEQAYAQLSDDWLTAVDGALSKNKSSFAVLPISQLLATDGWLAKLRAKGYSIQEPK
jgi:TraB/PrgY/gumN family